MSTVEFSKLIHTIGNLASLANGNGRRQDIERNVRFRSPCNTTHVTDRTILLSISSLNL